MNLLVLPGDDIGPEITVAALKVLPREERGINVPGTVGERLDLHANIRPARLAKTA
jgi:isocitrate/isopropylmalate dehydrogenase